MRIPYFVEVFTTESQDPEFDSIRQTVLGQDGLNRSLMERLDATKDALRIVDDYPNFKLWIPVFNMLDSEMFSIIAKFEKEMFLPFDHYSIFPSSTSVMVKERAAAKCTCECVEQGKELLLAIVRWQTNFVKVSIAEEEYNSLELLLVCLRAFDGELAYTTLNFLATLCLDPSNTRKPIVYDKANIFKSMSKKYFHTFCDLGSCIQTSAIMDVADLRAAAESAGSTGSCDVDEVKMSEYGNADTLFR